MSRYPWLVIEQPGLRAHCHRCNERLGLELPVRVTVYLAAVRAFEREHRLCQEPETAADELAVS